MSFAERADLVARLSLKDDFSRPLAGAQKKLKGFGSSLKSIGKGVGLGVGAAVGVAATFVTSQVKSGLDNLALLEDATTSVDGAIKQLGLTGKITSTQIAGWANDIEANTQAAFDDKDITAAATTLLRYGKVAPGALKQTLTVMTDLAAKTGSVDSAASALAKSLADPTKATRVLRQVGVTLTKAQEKQIKLWVKNGQLGKAQALILAEVAKKTKGAAAAMNGPYRDSQKVFADVTEDAQKALATGFLPILEEVRKELSNELAKPETLARIKDFGTTLAGGFRGLVQTLKGLPWNEIGATVGSIVNFGKNLGKGFLDLPPDVKGLLLGLFALNKVSGGAVLKISADLVGTGLSALFGQFLGRGSVANPMFVVPIGGGLGGGVPGGGLVPAAGAAGLSGLGILTGAAAIGVIVTAVGMTLARVAHDANPTEFLDPTKSRQEQPGWRPKTDRLGNPIAPHPYTALGAGKAADDLAVSKSIADKLDRARDRIESSRIALVSSQKTGDASIVAAIQANRPTINVHVTTSVTLASIARARVVKSSFSRGHVGAQKGM